jgi:hypothetical protein
MRGGEGAARPKEVDGGVEVEQCAEVEKQGTPRGPPTRPALLAPPPALREVAQQLLRLRLPGSPAPARQSRRASPARPARRHSSSAAPRHSSSAARRPLQGPDW